ncbi:MAG: phage tail fiber protein, partial [Pyrinomonadaceae bacterium]
AILGQTALPAIGSVYIALFTANPTDAGGGTEVTGGSYSRVTVTNNTTNFPNAAAGVKSNGTAFNFAQATAPWGTVTAVGVYDALTVGNLLFWAPLTTPRTIATGDTVSFAVGQLQFTEE